MFKLMSKSRPGPEFFEMVFSKKNLFSIQYPYFLCDSAFQGRKGGFLAEN